MNDPVFLFAVVFSALLIACGIGLGLYHGLRERTQIIAPTADSTKLTDALVTMSERVAWLASDMHERMLVMHEQGWEYTKRKQDVGIELARVEMQARFADLPQPPRVPIDPSVEKVDQDWDAKVAATARPR